MLCLYIEDLYSVTTKVTITFALCRFFVLYIRFAEFDFFSNVGSTYFLSWRSSN